ncbi:hypothetical protein ACKS0A_08068 [Histoplasma ohiense]
MRWCSGERRLFVEKGDGACWCWGCCCCCCCCACDRSKRWRAFDSVMELFRRKSWVTAMPMEAKARDVRSQARNVRSVPVLGTWLVEIFFFYS